MTVQTVKPMLASRGEVPLDSAEWTYEIKWDGMRAMVGGGRILSRHGTECTGWYPELRCALGKLEPRLQHSQDPEGTPEDEPIGVRA